VLPTNPETLVGYWVFDEASGTNAYDYSGNRNNGTLTNMNTTGNSTSGWNITDCKFGSCLKFDGVNDYVNIGDKAVLNIGGSTTVSAWVKPSSTLSSEVGFVTKYGGPYSWALRNVGQLLRFTVDQPLGTDWNVQGTTSLTKDNWWFIVGIYDSSAQKIFVYVNGVQEKSADGPTSIALGSDPVIIGGQNRNGFYFNGTIDEVMVFNRSLSADEVAALYETSVSKFDGSSSAPKGISAKATPAIVLSNPAGTTEFDDVTVTRDTGTGTLTMVVPYSNVELNGTLRLAKGEYNVQIRHMATNATTNKPIIELTAV
jgi:hypothetical protein